MFRKTFILIFLAYFLLIKVMTTTEINSNQVIVVGGGLAGLSAALEATAQGARVVLIDKEKNLGGNSAKATSGINGAPTSLQQKFGIQDNVESFSNDTLKSGDGLSDQILVKTLTSLSAEAIGYLGNHGLDFNDVVKLGGHSNARSHRFHATKEGKPVPVGFTIVNKLKNLVNEKGVKIITNCSFEALLRNQAGHVTGIKYKMVDSEKIEEMKGVVVLATGGYGHDRDENSSLIKKFTPQLFKLPTTNGKWATGDVIKMMEKENFLLVHLDKIQIHPTSFIDPKNPKSPNKFLAPESLRGVGAILLSNVGKRFVNELGRRDHVTKEIFKTCSNYQNDPDAPKVCLMLLNEKMIERFGKGMAGFYIMKGFITKVTIQNQETPIEAVARETKMDAEILKQTIHDYNMAAKAGKDEFGKTFFPLLFGEKEETYYVSFITPALHYCMGGVKITKDAQVVAKDNKPINGLFAAGEVTGGVHGENRLGGNSLLECVVFGKIAGKMAAIKTKNLNDKNKITFSDNNIDKINNNNNNIKNKLFSSSSSSTSLTTTQIIIIITMVAIVMISYRITRYKNLLFKNYSKFN